MEIKKEVEDSEDIKPDVSLYKREEPESEEISPRRRQFSRKKEPENEPDQTDDRLPYSLRKRSKRPRYTEEDNDQACSSKGPDTRGVYAGVICDGCQTLNSNERRLKCLQCEDLDLCWSCYLAGKIPEGHSEKHIVQAIEPVPDSEIPNEDDPKVPLKLWKITEYTCPICAANCSSQKKFASHVLEHSETVDGARICPICLYQATRPGPYTDLQYHVKAEHGALIGLKHQSIRKSKGASDAATMTDSGSLEGEEAVLPDDPIERILLFREQLMKAEKTLTILRQEKESAIESFVQKEHLDSVDVNVFRRLHQRRMDDLDSEIEDLRRYSSAKEEEIKRLESKMEKREVDAKLEHFE